MKVLIRMTQQGLWQVKNHPTKTGDLLAGQILLDQLTHHNIHIEGLLKQYPDITMNNLGTHIDFYSKKISSEVDEIKVLKDNVSTYVYLHLACPSKKVKIDCNRCEGLITVLSDPFKIPIFFEHEVDFATEYVLYSCNYEETLKNHNFNVKTLSEIQMYILKQLENHTAAKRKADIYYMNNSIKKLLPFT